MSDAEILYTSYTSPFRSPVSFPDLSPFKHPKVPGKKTVVYVRPTGSYKDDFEKAAKADGWLDGIPSGYMWHHTEKLGIMMLVKREAHDELSHWGGCAIYRALTRHKNTWD